MRVSNVDDIREDLELAVMELQDAFGVAPSSIRRYVNSALKATEREGVRGTPFLFRYWNRDSDTPRGQEPYSGGLPVPSGEPQTRRRAG